LLPQGVTVITGEEIRAAGLTHANEAIRWLGGVVGRIDTAGGRDQVLDLRGFGETAGSNVVILVDGVRQNEGDMTGAALAWIPVSSIERIEIVRGSSAVLYGEGATAGAINIITQKGQAEPGGTVKLGLGSLGTREAQASLNTVSGPWRLQINGSARNTDNHRENNSIQERSALGRATWIDGSSLISVQLGLASSWGLLPGGLTLAQFNQNSRQTNTPGDNGSTESANLLLSGETDLGDWRVAADFNHRSRETNFDYRQIHSLGAVKNNADRLGARVWREFKDGPLTQKILIGLDTEHWQQETTGYVFNMPAEANIKQNSSALYARHEVFFQPIGLKVFAGARRTFADRVSVGNPPGEFAATNTSWDFGAAMNLGTSSEVFGKIGSSFRLPNANEYTCYVGFCSGGANKLLPQASQDAELGWRQKAVWGQWTARLYRSNLNREIGFDPMIGNVNFDPTRREGIELDASAKLASQLDGGLLLAVRSATFRRGSYAGKTIPLVPNRSLTARLTYRQSGTQQWLLTSQWVSSQRIGDDFDNTGDSKIAGYATLNLRYSQKVDDWTFAIAANNLLDKHYYNYRTFVNPTYQSIYPEAGRTLLVSALRRF
jgi:iron complex outermembrane receptor protein